MMFVYVRRRRAVRELRARGARTLGGGGRRLLRGGRAGLAWLTRRRALVARLRGVTLAPAAATAATSMSGVRIPMRRAAYQGPPGEEARSGRRTSLREPGGRRLTPQSRRGPCGTPCAHAAEVTREWAVIARAGLLSVLARFPTFGGRTRQKKKKKKAAKKKKSVCAQYVSMAGSVAVGSFLY